jgi:hypothetical protein
LAIKEMHLAIFFDCREYSQHLLQDLSISSKSTDVKNKLLSYNLAYGDSGGISGWKCFSRLCGKKLIPGFSKENSCFWGFAKEEPKKYVDFIRGIDKNGKEILYSSNPSGLSNSYFDKNPTTPDYLTPVFFKKEVLDKYYQQPNKYSVEDGYLRCSGLWGVQIDNHHRDKVIVWLGDLGRDLPYQDQLHWRSYNIPPLGGVSETFFKRQILAQFADTDQPDLVFKHKYENFQVASQKKLGWYLFRPLSVEDSHFFDSLRIPANSDQKTFDEIILALAKVLVDSLNEKQLNALIPKKDHKNIKGGILILEQVLLECEIKEYEQHIAFLRDLQSLRSSSAAHRKGKEYQKIIRKIGIDNTPLSKVCEKIFVQAIYLLDFLSDTVEKMNTPMDGRN